MNEPCGEALDGVLEETTSLQDGEARQVERWVEDVVMRRRREESPTRS